MSEGVRYRGWTEGVHRLRRAVPIDLRWLLYPFLPGSSPSTSPRTTTRPTAPAYTCMSQARSTLITSFLKIISMIRLQLLKASEHSWSYLITTLSLLVH